MTIYRFLPVKERLAAPELGEYVSYGIRALALESGRQNEAAYISDVSCDERFVAGLADRCTRLQLDPGHLLDVVLDALD